MATQEQGEEKLKPVDHVGQSSGDTTRRSFLGAVAAAAAGTTLLRSDIAHAAKGASGQEPNLAASPPPGFTPFSAPGQIVKVTKPGSLQANKVYPKPDAAREMLTKAMMELTGEPDLPKAIGRFIHKDDKVCVKVNGIAMRNHATSAELVIPLLEAMIEHGVPAKQITVLEQYGSYMIGTRINEKNVPAGVKLSIHANSDMTMPERLIPGTGVRTKFCRALTESTAVINFSLIKDHSITGYTGCMKNMTHGTQQYPQYFHSHHASPQIAVLYAQDIIKSRVRLCITDAFQVMAHGGPLDKQPQYRFPYESVFVTTDPVAMDTIGWEIVEKFRADKGLKSLTAEGRAPAYIKTAADLGLGIGDRANIQVKELAIGDCSLSILVQVMMHGRDDDDGDTVSVTPAALQESSLRRGEACLVVIYGPELGRRIPLAHSHFEIGRSSKSDLSIDQESISRHHARIAAMGGSAYTLMDLGSTNGTYVNDVAISEHPLSDGDQIKIGRSILKFMTGDNIETSYHEEIYRLVTVDALTQLFNKRYFGEALEREFNRARRYKRHLSLFVIDLDHFKQINDRYGHVAGDFVLRQLAIEVKAKLRREDIFARVGGEEFGVLLPEVQHEGALATAEKVRKVVEAAPFTFDKQTIQCTVSIGVVTLEPSVSDDEDATPSAVKDADDAAAMKDTDGIAAVDDKSTPGSLYAVADSALYLAKERGRNRVEVA